MHVQEYKFIRSNFLVFFSHVRGTDEINDNNKFVVNSKFIAPYSKCAIYQILRIYAQLYFL